MLAVAHFALVAALAYQLRNRLALLAGFNGLPRYFLSLGLTLFLVSWANFLLYVGFGWSAAQMGLSWAVVLGPLLYFSAFPSAAPAGPPSAPFFRTALARLRAFRQWNYWFLFLAGFVLMRFYVGLDVDDDGHVWSNFNFVDTAFHLSVTNAFLDAPRFPPMDIDMAPYPLKYHFLADFHVAHLVRLGLPALQAIWLMNLVSAIVMVGSLWAVFERWLKLPARWVMLAGFIFLFLNTTLVNLVHYFALRPTFFNPQSLFDGLLAFPYFNFEFALSNLFEAQRGFLFSLPVVLLAAHALFGDPEAPPALARTRILWVFVLVCLMPLAHVVSFAVLALAAAPAVWRHRRWLLPRAWVWGPALVVGVLQLWYLLVYGPPTNAAYSAWDATASLPLNEFAAFPRGVRRALFWFFANGDFFFWGGLFAALAFWPGAGRGPGNRADSPLRGFLRQWRWYFAVCLFFFALINFYRYSFAWGDSNKFVLFLNLGLTVVIVLGASRWLTRWRGVFAYALWWFFLLLCAGPPAYDFYRSVLTAPHGMVLLFDHNGRVAADWLKHAVKPSDIVLTGANSNIHFVTPLAGVPTLAGIYGDSNPYRQDERKDIIRRIYEGGELGLLRQLNTRYVCVSRNERRKYRLSPKWTKLMKSGDAVAFHVGGGPDDNFSVFIFDSHRLQSR